MRGRILLALLVSLAAGALPASAQAIVFDVNDTADAPDAIPGDGSCDNGVNECTFRAAVEEANALGGPDAVNLLGDTYNLLVASGGAIEITDDLTITGETARTTAIRQEVDGGGDGLDRVFDVVGAGTDVTIAKVTVEDGRAVSGFFGGNIRSAGALTVDQSTITGGRASSGGGISNVGGTLNVVASTISGNTAPDGGGDSGAIQNFEPAGGPAPTLVVDTSTISGNTARNVGGILSWGDATSGGTITIRHSTIADNTSTVVANAAGVYASSNATASFENSIISGNSPANCGADPGASIVSNGYNLERDSECGFQSEGDIQDTDPFLGALENNQGGTDTQPPSVDSAAKDGGTCPPAVATGAAGAVQTTSANLTGTLTPPADQRGVIRPQESFCDMGAFELAGNFVASTSYRFDYGTTRGYGNQTPLTSVGSLNSSQAVSAPVTGLTPGAEHHYRLVATNGRGNGLGSDQAFTTQALIAPTAPAARAAKLADLPNPVQGVNTNVEPVGAGPVLVGIPAGPPGAGRARASQKGVRFVPLREARQIPVGSFLDTRKGTVRLQSARDPRGTRQQGDFGRGLFQVLQSRRRSARGLTDLVLKGSSFSRCRTAGRGKRALHSALRRSTRRRLRANARGRFRTRGRHSAATVRGTTWLTADRCDGTLTKVSRGRVAVRDFRRKRAVTLRAGKSYLARAPR